jgi:CheY-like chemotaxis protein
MALKKDHVPTCFFPTTTLFIDDSKDFLANFTVRSKDSMLVKVRYSPYDALEAIHYGKQPNRMNERVLREYFDTSDYPVNNQTINLNLSSIHWEIYNPMRFSEVSVVVVDFAMPGMNGLEFCKKMENSPIKRILLTGKADEKNAVEAFNSGLIDMYIKKNAPDMMAYLRANIQKMQLRYFQNMSDLVIKMLSVKSPNCLQDPAFARQFYYIVAENHIEEYYLTESSGSFLMLDTNGNLSYFAVKSQQDLELYCEMAEENNAPQEIIEQLKKGEKIPYFWQARDYYKTDWEDWESFLYPAQKIKGRDTFYYSYIKNPDLGTLPKDEVTTYDGYLAKYY